jgi:small GTP-binding protein
MTQAGPFRARVVIIGDSSVGKTSLLSSLLGSAFNPHTEPTVGANWQSYTPPNRPNALQLQLWDTAGQERYRSLGPLYYRGAVGGVVVYDVTNRCSFDNVRTWISAFQNTAGTEAALIVVGNAIVRACCEAERDKVRTSAEQPSNDNLDPPFPGPIAQPSGSATIKESLDLDRGGDTVPVLAPREVPPERSKATAFFCHGRGDDLRREFSRVFVSALSLSATLALNSGLERCFVLRYCSSERGRNLSSIKDQQCEWS